MKSKYVRDRQSLHAASWAWRSIRVGHLAWRSAWAVAALMAAQRGSEATGSRPASRRPQRSSNEADSALRTYIARGYSDRISGGKASPPSSKVGIMLREREGGCEEGTLYRPVCKRLAGHSLQGRVPSASCLFLSIHLPRQSTDSFEILLVNRSNRRQHGRFI